MAVSISSQQLKAISANLAQSLNQINANVVSQVLAERLPILGDNLKDAAAATSQLNYARNLGEALKEAADRLADSGASFTEAEVEAALNAALASKGYGGTGVDASFISATSLKLDFATQRTGDTASVAIESDLGLPNLGLATSGTAQVTLDTAFSFAAGIDASGFYVAADPDTSFTINSKTTLPNFTGDAMLGGLGFTLSGHPGDIPDFNGNFDITLKDSNGKIRLGELNGDLVDATMSGTCDADFKLVSKLPAGSALPKFETNFSIGWSFLDDVVDPADSNSDFGVEPAIDFGNVSVDVSSFFNGFAGRLLDEIARVTEPLQPVIDFLTTPIPILSDLGSDKVTLLDFAGESPETTAAIKGLADIIELANLAKTIGAAGKIDLGTLRIDGDIRSERPEDVIFRIFNPNYTLEQQNAAVGDFLTKAAEVAGGGLAFPILSDIRAIGKMLMGQDADLFSYNSGFSFGSEPLSLFFPVLGPIGIRLSGEFMASARFGFGFDAKGARDYFASGMSDPTKVFDGFYVQGVDDAGNIVTGFSVGAKVEVDAEANLGFANAGVGGDITANVFFGLDELLLDSFGKLRGSKLFATPVADLFDPSGMLTCGLHAYLEVGFSPFSVEFSFDSPRVVLLNFDGEDADPVLADITAPGTLSLNIGDRSAFRVVGNLEDIAEKIAVVKAQSAVGLPMNALELQGFKVLKITDIPGTIVGNGGLRGDEIAIAPDVTSVALLSGGLSRDILNSGAGRDTLRGDEGPDVLSSYGEVDLLFGGDGNDRLIGGTGGDTLDGGADIDTASYVTAAAGMTIDLRTMLFTGDGAGDTLISVERYEGTNFNDVMTGNDADNSLLGGLDGDDLVRGLAGTDVLNGGKGNDRLAGGGGTDLLIGGEGADALDGGTGIDAASYMHSKAPVTVSLLTGTGTAGDALGDTLTGIEVLYGSPLPFGDFNSQSGSGNVAGTGDTLEGDDGANTISGIGGADFISGQGGDDVLYGDSKNGTEAYPLYNIYDADTLRGGDGNDQLFGQQGDDDLDGGTGQDNLDGAGGDDHLRTMDTGSIDILDGGAGTNRLSADYSDKTVSINWTAGQLNDFTFADGDSQRNFQNVGELNTGSAIDRIILDNAADDRYDNIIRTNGGNDIVRSGAGDDHIEGGAGSDRLFGGANGDYIDGGTGNDFVHAGSNTIKLKFDSFNTVIGVEEGVPDRLFGGTGVDTVSFEEMAKSVVYVGIGTNNGKTFGLGVTIDLAANTAGRAAEGVTISGFENVIGTNYLDELFGTDANNVFQPLRGGGQFSGATSGPDRIDGRGGIDTLIIDFSLADLPDAGGVNTNATSIYRNTLDNSAGVDSYIYSNIERLNITGAGKNDVLYSWTSWDAPGDDVLSGLGGDDMLGGKGGSDTLLGGGGNDRLSAQGTFDLSYGGIAGGRDVINGGGGDDIVENIAFGFGGPVLGADAFFRLDGGSGFDILSADFSNQSKAIVWNSAAPSNMVFEDGAFARNFEQLRHFASGSGNDRITQLGRVDTQLYGGGGDDVLNGGLGNDGINGGDGNDLAVIDFSILDTPDLTGVQGGGGGAYYRTKTGDFARIDNVMVYAVEAVKVTGTSKDDNFAGTNGDDTLIGGAGNDTLDGFWGGNNILDGGSGNDILKGSYGWAGSGSADVMIGGDGDDLLQSRTGNDDLRGGAGNDILLADLDFAIGFGSDRMLGGDGDDIITNINFNSGYNYAKASDRLYLDGGNGFDTLSADFSTQTQAITFIAGISNSTNFADGSYLRNFERLADFISGDGADSLTLTGRFNNNISARGGDDVVDPGLGHDLIFGGLGSDLLVVDYSKDDVDVSGVSYDNLGALVRRSSVTEEIVDRLLAYEFERAQLTGGSLNDVFVGLAGDDTLRGMNGDDIVRGGGGKDTLDGGLGSDTADYGDKFVSVEVTLNGLNAATVTVGGVAEDSIRGFERVAGGFANDTLTGDAAGNVLTGGDGNDTLTGGGGADSFAFTRLFGGVDTIADFRSVDDTILITAAGFGGGLVAGGAVTLVRTTDFVSATGSVPRFIYDTAGADAGLYFDVTGGSASDSVMFARLTGLPNFALSDIVLV